MKRFYLTTQATQTSWNYVGDPKNPNTTLDVGIITVEDKSEIRVDDFGMYVERELLVTDK